LAVAAVTASATYEELRPLIFSIAYRMLGSAAEAEDIVQEAFLRLYRASDSGEEDIENPRAWLSAVATRLSIDHLRSARVQRESYIGTWLPEPLLTAQEPDVAQSVENADTLSLAFLVVLESLSPVERAVFLLRDVFGYSYGEIAEVIGKSEDNARQLLVRARRRVEDKKPRFEASLESREKLARRFLAAAEDGDTEGLFELLAEDAALYGDGGGKAPAIPRPIFGRDRLAKVLSGFARQAQTLGVHPEYVEVNGQPGALFRDGDGLLVNVISLDIADGHVQAIRSIVNPEKLGHLGPLADIPALFARARSST
jgi:RNA polymerase sigma-70 factor (ECF subfamily)